MVKIDDERGQLKQNDLDYLCNFTRFDKTEILDWFRYERQNHFRKFHFILLRKLASFIGQNFWSEVQP